MTLKITYHLYGKQMCKLYETNSLTEKFKYLLYTAGQSATILHVHIYCILPGSLPQYYMYSVLNYFGDKYKFMS